MKRIVLKILLLAAAMALLFTGASCNRTSGDAFNEDNLIPEKVLAGLPVYPDAAMTTEDGTGFKPFSTPLSPQVEGRPPEIVYETVSRQYTSEAEPDSILKWYRSKLTGKGYQVYSETSYFDFDDFNIHNKTETSTTQQIQRADIIHVSGEVHSLGFYRPKLTLISIEVHACSTTGKTIFAVIVNRDTTTPAEPEVMKLSTGIISYSGFKQEASVRIGEPRKDAPVILTIANSGDVRYGTQQFDVSGRELSEIPESDLEPASIPTNRLLPAGTAGIYQIVHLKDRYEDRLLFEAKKSNDGPPDYLITDNAGAVLYTLPMNYLITRYRYEACLVENGLAVYYGTNVLNSRLKKYSYDGSIVWSAEVPLTGSPHLSRIQDNGSELLALRIQSSDNEHYVGYFTAENGTMFLENKFTDDRRVQVTDKAGYYYLFTEWPEYYEMAVPPGRISLFYGNEEAAYADVSEGIYYFAASPDGRYFAVVTRNRLSIFSFTE